MCVTCALAIYLCIDVGGGWLGWVDGWMWMGGCGWEDVDVSAMRGVEWGRVELKRKRTAACWTWRAHLVRSAIAANLGDWPGVPVCVCRYASGLR